jgi:hypothetical protein
MTSDETLGGYINTHACPPAFLGPDGISYSVDAYVDEDPDENGQYGAAVLFIRWSESGSQPEGHLETGYLAHGDTPGHATSLVERLTLFELKELLDRLVEESKGRPAW